LLKSDSYNAAEQAALQKLELDSKWKDRSISTDYSADDLSVTWGFTDDAPVSSRIIRGC
jgi:hypothetical protein